jgi:hypothetical protein
MTKDFEELFACLRHRNVEALVVGGYAVAGHYGSEAVDYIGRVELIRNKRASGRPQDLLDIEGLE